MHFPIINFDNLQKKKKHPIQLVPFKCNTERVNRIFLSFVLPACFFFFSLLSLHFILSEDLHLFPRVDQTCSRLWTGVECNLVKWLPSDSFRRSPLPSIINSSRFWSLRSFVSSFLRFLTFFSSFFNFFLIFSSIFAVSLFLVLSFVFTFSHSSLL